MNGYALADELADIRGEIARLRKREAVLRTAILSSNGQVPDGRWSRVEVTEHRARVFDKKLLPLSMQADPRYWRVRVQQQVRCLPIQVGGSRPEGTPFPTRLVALP
ncbi:MAG: hypothetical protein ACWA5A_05060 [Marinibacterium sp.]